MLDAWQKRIFFMRLNEAKKGTRYIVTTNGQTLRKGDHIYFEKDDCLVCKEAGGWLLKEDWKRLRNQIEVDWEYYNKIRLKTDEILRKVQK